MKPLKDCEYTAFISYAHADDDAWYGWVTCFRNELERGLRALLRGVPLPRLHLSEDNGPVAGVLSEQLKQRVESSFAMIIVVHDNYAHSSWCLKELEYFRALWGDAGLHERLYILALSEPAMREVSTSAAWQRLLPHDDQLWVPFYDDADKTRPLDIYMGPGLVATAFRAPFERLRSDLAAKLRRSVAGAAPDTGAGGSPRRPTPDPATPAAAVGATLLGLVPPASAAAAAAAVARLGALGVAARQLGADAVFADFADFDQAAALVLAVDDEPPMMGSLAAGGHLQLQREAWLRRGRGDERLFWLDLRNPAHPPGPGAAYAASVGAELLAVDDLAARLRPAAPGPPPAPAAVRVYIESNRHERTLWEPLGEQIRRQWEALADELAPGRVPPLTLRARGLPVDQIDGFPDLDDADGVVLLWGRKTSDALVAQINKVENKMTPGRDAAPGIVAYLMPPQQASEPIPAWGWQVLRFDARDEEAIAVVDDEADALRRFLHRVLRRWQQREQAGASAAAAGA